MATPPCYEVFAIRDPAGTARSFAANTLTGGNQ